MLSILIHRIKLGMKDYRRRRRSVLLTCCKTTLFLVLQWCVVNVNGAFYECYVCTTDTDGDKCGATCCNDVKTQTSCLACAAEGTLVKGDTADGQKMNKIRRVCIEPSDLLPAEGCMTNEAGTRQACVCHRDNCNGQDAFADADREEYSSPHAKKKKVEAPEPSLFQKLKFWDKGEAQRSLVPTTAVVVLATLGASFVVFVVPPWTD